MELQIEDETVEPSITSFTSDNRSPARRRFWPGMQAALERYALGRLCLGTLQWAVVLALVLTGYFTAAGIDSGVTALRQSGAANAQILAASAARK